MEDQVFVCPFCKEVVDDRSPVWHLKKIHGFTTDDILSFVVMVCVRLIKLEKENNDNEKK